MNRKVWSCDNGKTAVIFTRAVRDELEGLSTLAALATKTHLFIICGTSERAQALSRDVCSKIDSSRFVVQLMANAQEHVPVESVDEAYGFLPDPAATPFFFLVIGGGSPVGLAKALSNRFSDGIFTVVVPTSYSGSEMSAIFGITTGNQKIVQRNEKVRANMIVYDIELVRSIPKKLALPSAFNALAHAVEALNDETASPVSILMAEEAFRTIFHALHRISLSPDHFNDDNTCYDLLYGAYLAGSVLDSNKMGIQHKAAHTLGGTFHCPHAEVHTVLLPHSIYFNKSKSSSAMHSMSKTIAAVTGANDATNICPAEALWDLQKKLGVPTSLRSLMFNFDNIASAADLIASAVIAAANKNSFSPSFTEPMVAGAQLAANISSMLAAAHLGRRPCSRARHSFDPLKYCVPENVHRHRLLPAAVVGVPINKASIVVVCVHGRFASAEGIINQLESIIGVQHSRNSASVTIIAPQAHDNTFYPVSFLQPQSVNQPKLAYTMELIHSCVQYACEFVPSERVYLFGFSQGACAVLSYAMQRQGARLGGVFAFSGGLIGAEDEINLENYPGDSIKGVNVLLGCADADDHVPASRIYASCKLLESRGAVVDCDIFPASTEHKIFPLSAKKLGRIWATVTQQSKNVAEYSDNLVYLSGFGNLLQSEALPGAVPANQRLPSDPAYGLVTEVITGSSFCAPRGVNFTSTFYRIHPSIGTHGAFSPYSHPNLRGDFCCRGDHYTPEPIRWAPIEQEEETLVDFIDGLKTIAGTGNPMSSKGIALHTYSCNISMKNRAFYNSDGNMLIIPELGCLHIQTEFGHMKVVPGEIFILPRGLKMTIAVTEPSRGFCAEVYEISGLQLPQLGPIGQYGLADPRHFMVPTAAYEDIACKDYELISKFGGSLFRASLQYSPYDVVGWMGRYYPCKYNLYQFMALGSVTWDHCDPSLHTVLTCPVDAMNGASACDLVCFRSRYDAAQHTFRPPYYHRNMATEFNMIIEIKSPYSGFQKGNHWLTPCMTAHGISGTSFNGFMNSVHDDEAHMISEDSLWLMIESIYPLILTDVGALARNRETSYPRNFFSGVPRKFSGPSTGSAADMERTRVLQKKG